jgi:hypothetical protein
MSAVEVLMIDQPDSPSGPAVPPAPRRGSVLVRWLLKLLTSLGTFAFMMAWWGVVWGFGSPRVVPTEEEFHTIGYLWNFTIWGDGCLCCNIPLILIAGWIPALLAGVVVYPWGMSVIMAGFVMPVLNFLRPAPGAWSWRVFFWVGDFFAVRTIYVMVICFLYPHEIALAATDKTLASIFDTLGISFEGYLSISFAIALLLGVALGGLYLLASFAPTGGGFRRAGKGREARPQ